jgi:hypothetical protein
MSKTSTRTTVSTDSLPAVHEPPTRIHEDEMRLDPKKVIAAWLASAEVLRDVAEAVRENQADNERTLEMIEVSNKRAIQLMCGIVAGIQILSLIAHQLL